MADDRDIELGVALRQLDVPEHGATFWPRLQVRLKDESATRPSLASPATPRWRRPTLLLSVAAAIIVAVLVVNVALPSAHRGPVPLGPQVASATEVRTHVASALASAKSLRADLTLECAVSLLDCQPPDGGQGRTVLRWSVVATADGDERLTALAPGAAGTGAVTASGGDTAYLADQRTERSIGVPSQGGDSTVFTDLPAGPPDFTRHSPLGREYGSVVRAFLSSNADAPVTDTTDDGRPAWQLAMPVAPDKLAGPGQSGDRIEIVVDKATGFPLQVTETLGGRFLYQSQLSNLSINGPVDPSAFVLNLPAGPKVLHQDYGFRTTTLGQIATAVGYRPVLPAYLPPGYRVTQISVARQALATGSEGLNPPSTNVVSVAYRRGFDLIVVTTRTTGPDRSAWYDPMGTAEGVTDQPERSTVTQGPLAGAIANMVVTPGGTPHVWTVDDHLVVTISGDATHDELVHMVNSMSEAS